MKAEREKGEAAAEIVRKEGQIVMPAAVEAAVQRERKERDNERQLWQNTLRGRKKWVSAFITWRKHAARRLTVPSGKSHSAARSLMSFTNFP